MYSTDIRQAGRHSVDRLASLQQADVTIVTGPTHEVMIVTCLLPMGQLGGRRGARGQIVMHTDTL